MNEIVTEYKDLRSDLAIIKNTNHRLEGKIIYLKKTRLKRNKTAAEVTLKFQVYQTVLTMI